MQNKKHGIYRLGGLERVRGGEKVIIRAREREKKKNRSVMFHIITRAYESRLACQTLISN